MMVVPLATLPVALTRARGWLNEPSRAGRVWLGPPCVIAAWLGVLLAVVSRPEGVGIPLCWFYSATGIQCLGCGLTRSLSCALRGLFAESWAYHPFGIALLLLFLATAAQGLLPRRLRDQIRVRMEARAVFCNAFYVIFVVLFIAYGAGRALAQLIH